MSEHSDSKQEQITDAALKRFIHFGISKTTMNEIAEDLAISKALLYYYFPDKTSLVLEVGRHILTRLIEEQSVALQHSGDFKSGFRALIDTRIEFSQKYFMMHIGDGQSELNLNDQRFTDLMTLVKERELNMLSDFIQKHIATGELRAIDTRSSAQVLVDTMTGIWICEIHLNKKELIPTEEQFERIRQKTALVIDILYNGLKKN